MAIGCCTAGWLESMLISGICRIGSSDLPAMATKERAAMNSRVTMVLAGLLLVGAVIAGYWGLSLSRQPQVVEAVAEPAPTVAAPSIELPSLPAREQEQRVPVVV